MLTAVHNFFFPPTPPQPPSFLLETRMAEIKKEAEEIYKEQTGESVDITVAVDAENVGAIKLSDKILHLHPLLFLNPDDLPEHLRIDTIDSSRLTDPKWGKEMGKWLIDNLKFEGYTRDLLVLLILCICQNKPNFSKNMRRFTVAHEMGHLHYKEGNRINSAVAIPLAFLYSAILCGFTIPFLIVAFVAARISFFILSYIQSWQEQNEELHVDLGALKFVQDFEAIKYSFRFADIIDKKLWEKVPLTTRIFKTIFYPESVFFGSHPTGKVRIKQIEQHQKRLVDGRSSI